MYYGVNYYPEEWDTRYLVADLSRMAELGINCIYIAKSAWHIMEPVENEYDFSFFTQVLDIAHLFNIKVVLGVPTSRLPAWMVKEYHVLLSIDEFGNERQYGHKHHICLNSPVFLDRSQRLIEHMTKAYSDHPAVIGWQIDDELGNDGKDWCYCDVCENKFRAYLKNEFHDIDKLNYYLGTNSNSQMYNYFNEIRIPKKPFGEQNPSLVHYHQKFRVDTINDFISHCNKILGANVPKKHFISTPLHGDYFTTQQDSYLMNRDLDVVSLNNHILFGGKLKPVSYTNVALRLAITRGLKDNQPFWVTSQDIGQVGNGYLSYLPRPNEVYLWSIQAMLNGAKNILYSRYRTSNIGISQLDQGIFDDEEESTQRAIELIQVIKDSTEYHKCFLDRPKAQICLLHSSENILTWQTQKLSLNLDIEKEYLRMFNAFHSLNIPVDIISTHQDFSKYKVVLLPIPSLISDEMVDKLEEFILNGGSVVCSFNAGVKNIYNNYNMANKLLKLAGVTKAYKESLNSHIKITNHTKTVEYRASVFREMLVCNSSPEVDSKILYAYTDEYQDYVAVSLRKIGNNDGRIYYIGCGVDDIEFWQDFAIKAARRYELEYYHSPAGVEVYPRLDKVFILNYTNTKIDYLAYTLNPYQVLIVDRYEFNQNYGTRYSI